MTDTTIYLLNDIPASWSTDCILLNTNPIIGKYHRPWENRVIVSQLYEVNKNILKKNKDLNIFIFPELNPYYNKNDTNYRKLKSIKHNVFFIQFLNRPQSGNNLCSKFVS